ncbi:MAG: EAL domain-containing protein [Burkholderiales bacterium]|nr:EAL domain-containing protein [Burkholderiales bacterium]
MPKRLTPAGIALIYAALAALWIVASGALLSFAVDDPLLQGRIELIKGLAFVAVTSGLLYLVLRVWHAQSLASLVQKTTADRLLQHFYNLPFSGMAITSAATKRWVQFNDRLCAIFGYSREELAGKSWAEMTHPEDLGRDVAEFERVMRGESEGYTMDKRFIRKDGTVVFATIDVKCIRKPDGAVDFFVATVQDISGSKAAEAKFQRLTRFYAALSQSNEAVVRCASEEELFPKICRAAVQFGGMKMAWIGLLDEAGKRVRPVASYGEGMEYLEGIRISADADDFAGSGPSGITIRENQPYWCQDFRNDPVTAPWHERGARFGWGASAALPLCRNGAPIGVLNLYASEAGAFDEAARRLLVEMAANISFALDNFAREAARERTEEDLRESEARFRSLTEMSSDFYWESDVEHRLTARGSADRKVSTVSVFQQGAQIGDRRWEISYVSPDEVGWQAHRAVLDAHLPFRNFELSRIGVDGTERYISVSGDPMFDESGAFKGYRGVGTDITERKAAEQRIEHLAQHDLLTDLPNRVLLNDRVEVAVAHAARHGGRLALLYVDLDKFKFVNDTLGHAVGDQLLKAAAMRIKSAIRESDAASRVGGDEFVVLLSEINAAEDAARVAEKIIRDVSDPYRLNEHELVLTASIGIAIYPENGQDAGELLRLADTAMFAAKGGGRNRYQFYSEAMGARAAERLHLESELRGACARGEIFVAYQPQIDLASGRVIGAEALARWRHPRHGLISPLRFIPVAEESGLILEIGEWILREACRQARDWREQDILDAHVSVNVSAVQFRQADFLEVVKRALDASGLLPANLELEVTESVVMEGVSSMLDILRRLDAFGVKLAIDDFGTGYSSLSYLRQFPTQRLKIDQSFVRDLPGDPDAVAIARAIVSMGHSLGMHIIAEGVENEAQAVFLSSIGCEEAQGYLYAKPMPGSEFEAWVAARKAR